MLGDINSATSQTAQADRLVLQRQTFGTEFPRLTVDATLLLDSVAAQHCEVIDRVSEMERSAIAAIGLAKETKLISYPKSGELYPGPLFDAGCLLIRAVQEEALLSTRVSTFKTFREVWEQSADFRRMLNSSETKDPANFGKWALRKCFGYNIPATFIPCLARTFYDVLGARVQQMENSVPSNSGSRQPKRLLRVLDPCAGWGDRLLGALSSEYVAEYVGIDCNEAVIPGYKEIVRLWSERAAAKGQRIPKVTLLNQPIEQLVDDNLLPSDYFDVVFTSPPFFDYEVYSEANPTYRNWETEFYRPLVQLSRRVVKENGVIAFHIDDTSAGQTPVAISQNAVEVWAVDVGFNKRLARTWILEKRPRGHSIRAAGARLRGRGLVKAAVSNPGPSDPLLGMPGKQLEADGDSQPELNRKRSRVE